MEDSLHQHPPLHPRQAALVVVETLRSAGHRAYFAGGCVRDELLGREPDDYDVATDATPDRISSLFRRTSQVGASFGVVLVKYGPSRDAGTVEVATFRSDGTYSDRRRPDHVSFSDPLRDAQRRDFTVNALFLDPVNDVHAAEHAAWGGTCSLSLAPQGGTVVDFVGGRRDLEARLLRAVGDPERRLAEDHLRALRAVRLATKLGFRIDDATASAIRKHAAELSGVSRERIGDELRAMMALPARADAISLLNELSLDCASLDEPPQTTAVTPPRLVALLPPAPTFPTCLAAWALDRGLGPLGSLYLPDPEVWHGVATPLLLTLCSRWRKALCLSNEERDALEWTLHWVGLLASGWQGLTTARKRRASASQWFAPAFQILAAIAAAEPPFQSKYEQIRRDIDTLRSTPPGLAPPPLIGGDDLIRNGFAAGPRFRKLLELLYDAQLESRITTREEGLELARSLSV